MRCIAPRRVQELRSPERKEARLSDFLEIRASQPSLFVQTQYRGNLQATAIACAGALHAARRSQAAPHFAIRPASPLSRCFTLAYHTMPDGQTMILKDTSEKHTSISRPARPADHNAETNKADPVSQDAQDGLDFEPSAFDRSEKTIDYIVRQILPNIPHLISVPTKTPYVRDFPNENLNTPFEEWEVQNLQHMTLVSNGSRGVAWARGDWQDEFNIASPHSGFRSGTATPRSERDTNRIRTKMSLADYKAGANKRTTKTSQPPRPSVSQDAPNGQSSVSKDSISPTQQLIDQIIENNTSKLVPKFSDDHPVNIVRPPRPDPPYISDAPHPKPLPKPQRQAEEGRAVWPPPNKPDWKQPQHQDGPIASRAKPKRSDYAIMPSHPQHHLNQQKRLEPEQKRQKLEEKQASKRTTVKQLPLNSPNGPVPKQSHPANDALASLENDATVALQLSSSQSINEQTSAAPAGLSVGAIQLNSSKSSQKEHSIPGKPTSIDINVTKPVNAMPPLLSPLPAALISPDYPGVDGNIVSDSSKSNQAPQTISMEPKNADLRAAEQSQNEIISPLESPFEMPRLLSPLPDWWMKKIDIDTETVRRHDVELLNSNTATLGARRERSRQPDTPGVARKTPKATKSKSGLAKDLTTTSSAPARPSESIAKLDKSLDTKGREKQIVKLKYGKRNTKTITRLLQMQARPVTEAKSLPAPAKPVAVSEFRKHARPNDDAEEPSAKRSKVSKSDVPPSVSLEPDTKKHSQQTENAEEIFTKNPKVYHIDNPAPSSTGSNSKKRLNVSDEIEEHSNKRPKVSGNVDVQRARTPLTPNAQSPAPSANQKQFNTPKRGDAMKSVAMRKVDSNEGQVLTPHGGSVSTPASTEKLRTVSSDGKVMEIDPSKGTFEKYMTIGTTLKRKADQILKIKEKDHGPVSDEEKRLGTVIAIEAAGAYMIAYDSKNKSRHKDRIALSIENWSSFMPLMIFVTERAKGQGVLFTLALLLNWISRESLERLYMERIAADLAGASPELLKEVAKNSQARQFALSAYRNQCREHPVEFTVSIDEAKDVFMNILTDYCKKFDVAWESKLEL